MWTWKSAKRVVVAVLGGTVILIGVLLGPLPFVPAIVIIPLGLAILATEFVWAQRLLKKVKEKTMSAAGSVGWRGRTPETPLAGEQTADGKNDPETEGRASRPPSAEK